MIIVNRDRIESVAKMFKSIGIENVTIFENIDPQYLYIMKAISMCKSDHLIYAFYINALVAYRLKTKGEHFWKKFTEFIVKNCDKLKELQQLLNLIKEFTYRYNNYAYENKLKRIMKIGKCLDVLSYTTSTQYLELARKTSECLKTSYEYKTVVFSIKIVYYFHKAQGLESVLPFELPIPVDSRVAYMTYTSSMIDVVNQTLNRNIISLIMKKADTVRDIWNRVAAISYIPPLHIDAVLWYFGKYSRNNNRRSILEEVCKNIYIIDKEIIKKIVDELYFRLPE
ncbi:MAG: N-glycosylase/DNA lyase [Ignisphaera sp.]